MKTISGKSRRLKSSTEIAIRKSAIGDLQSAMSRHRATTTFPAIVTNPAPSGAWTLMQAATENMKWREFLNPIRDLDITKIVSWLEWEQRGVFADLQWAYHFIERYSLLAALVERRMAALDELTGSVKMTSDKSADKVLAAEQQALLQERYAKIRNVDELITDCAMAQFRGYSLAQPINDAEEVDFVNPTQIVCFDRWNFSRVGRKGDFYWNPRALPQMAESLGEANRVDPDSIILRECDRPIDRAALTIFQRQQECEKNWDGFIWIFGIPLPIIIGPSNVPPDKERAYEAAAATVAAGGTGYLPNGSSVEYPDSVRGTAPFKERLEWLREQIVIHATGGLLTVLAMPQGIGHGSGKQHEDAFKQIARAEAMRISRKVFQKYLDARMLAAEFPGKPALAYFEISANEVRDPSEVCTDAANLVPTGYTVAQADLEERTGYKLAPVPVAVGAAAGAAARSTISALARNRAAAIASGMLALCGDVPGHEFHGNQHTGGTGAREFSSEEEARQQFDRDFESLQQPQQRAPMRLTPESARKALAAGIIENTSAGKQATFDPDIEKHWAGYSEQERNARLGDLNYARVAARTGLHYGLPGGKDYYIQSFRDPKTGFSARAGVVIAKDGHVVTWWTQRAEYLKRGDVRNRKVARQAGQSTPDTLPDYATASIGSGHARLAASCGDTTPEDSFLQHIFRAFNRAPEVDEPQIGTRKSSIANLLAASAREISAAERTALAPVFQAMDQLIKTPDAEFQAAAATFLQDLPKLAQQAGQDPATAAAWERVLSAALINGWDDEKGGKS